MMRRPSIRTLRRYGEQGIQQLPKIGGTRDYLMSNKDTTQLIALFSAGAPSLFGLLLHQ